ncbi:MAG: hypothetical protein V4733_08725 [Verrucomicrobiota bacterium]
MKNRLVIDLATLPEEGKDFCGEIPEAVFDLPEGDAKPLGPLKYDLRVQRFESELLLTGSISAPFQFECVRTLHPFTQTIRPEHVAMSLNIENQSEIDVTEALREEILLNFPVTPRCENGDAGDPCEIDSRYLSVDKPAELELTTPPRVEGDDRWSALDDLKDLKDKP